MRTLPALAGLLAALGLGCGFMDAAVEPAAPGPAAPAPVEPAPAAPAPAPTPVGTAGGGPVKLIQDPNVTIVNPEIPEGVVLGEVESDYERLAKTGKIESCPEGTSLKEKPGTDGPQIYCALENGVRHGPWIAFWPNGKVREIGPYVKGFRHGTFTTWSSRGKLNSRYTWTNGQVGAGQVF